MKNSINNHFSDPHFTATLAKKEAYFYAPKTVSQADYDFYIDGISSLNQLIKSDRIEDLYHDFSGKIKAFILKNSGNEEDAKNIFQETLMALMYRVTQGDFELKARLGTFLHSIWRNKWFNHIRKYKPEILTNAFQEAEDELLSKEETETTALYAKLYDLLETEKVLTLKRKELLCLILEGHTNKEIAAIKNMTEGAVARAKHGLFKVLKEHVPLLFPNAYKGWKFQ